MSDAAQTSPTQDSFNDPAYREQQKAQSLSRYYRNKMDGGM